jgi:hypothetical protein
MTKHGQHHHPRHLLLELLLVLFLLLHLHIQLVLPIIFQIPWRPLFLNFSSLLSTSCIQRIHYSSAFSVRCAIIMEKCLLMQSLLPLLTDRFMPVLEAGNWKMDGLMLSYSDVEIFSPCRFFLFNAFFDVGGGVFLVGDYLLLLETSESEYSL